MSLYVPPAFRVSAPAWELVREHPLLQLITIDEQQEPQLSWVPMHIQQVPQEGPPPIAGRLLGHLAKANPQTQTLARQPLATAICMGPQAYMPTTVYPDALRVPTWNYLVVSLKLRARILEDNEAKDALLKHLIADHQPAYAEQWRNLPSDFTERMLRAIVAYEFEVLEVQAKFKLNQHRPEAHPAMHAHYANGNEQEQSLAQWMQRLGLVR
jgi:transcriptional regulator